MPRGGYRKPEKPAPASGPGRLSRRTDGGPSQKMRVAPGGAYGERQEMEEIQRSAPMSGSDPAPSPSGSQAMPVDTSGLTPLDAPSAYPDREITFGTPSGPGPHPDDVFGNPERVDEKTRERLSRYLPTLMVLASSENASQQTKDFVRRLRADLG